MAEQGKVARIGDTHNPWRGHTGCAEHARYRIGLNQYGIHSRKNEPVYHTQI